MNDARGQRCLVAPQGARIAGAIPIFVMELDGWKVDLKTVDAFQDLAPDGGMQLDNRKLFSGEGAGLLENTVTDSNFPYVVEQSAYADVVDIFFTHVGGCADCAGDFAHTPAVSGRIAIAGV